MEEKMSRPPTDKQERIIKAAVKLVHERGFARCSLAQIAQEAGVPTGSVYYFFKSKGELAEAILQQHQTTYAALCALWDELPSASDRLVAFLQMTVERRRGLTAYGCPVATLGGEVQKEVGGPHEQSAGRVFQELIHWLQAQFAELEHADPYGDAVHLLSAIEGATLLSHTLRDPGFIEQEVARLTDWIHS